MMRRVRYAVAVSLDGYIAGPDDQFDWIVADPDIDFASIYREFDTVLVGRRTFEAMAKEAVGGPDFGMTTYVFSRSLVATDHPSVIVLGDDGKDELRAVRSRPGKDIWLFGGGVLFRSLFQADLVDAVELAIVPVLLGRGIPFLPPSDASARLTLTNHTVYPNTGTVRLEYAIARREGQAG